MTKHGSVQDEEDMEGFLEEERRDEKLCIRIGSGVGGDTPELDDLNTNSRALILGMERPGTVSNPVDTVSFVGREVALSSSEGRDLADAGTEPFQFRGPPPQG